jgi:hypothetical protein
MLYGVKIVDIVLIIRHFNIVQFYAVEIGKVVMPKKHIINSFMLPSKRKKILYNVKQSHFKLFYFFLFADFLEMIY